MYIYSHRVAACALSVVVLVLAVAVTVDTEDILLMCVEPSDVVVYLMAEWSVVGNCACCRSNIYVLFTWV